MAYKDRSLWYVVTSPSIFSNVVLYDANNACATLPVTLTSFTATRTGNIAMLRWETSTEQNASGFSIEKLVTGVWQEVSFVPSLATGGNSIEKLIYQYSDPNAEKGITQYRLR